MDSGQVILMYSRLILGALAVFFAIMLWSKTRDAAWMFVIIGILTAYIEIICSILELLGVTAGNILYVGSVSIVAIVLPVLRMLFFIAAFLIMIIRQHWRET
jgi:hypothetical protein